MDRRLEPQPGPQTSFLTSQAQMVVFGGQAGGGKSYGLILAALNLCLKYADFRCLMLRKMLRSGVMSIWEEMVGICADWPEVKQVHRSAFRIYFANGSSIQLGHLQKPDSFRSWQGGQFQAVLFDEIAEGFTEREVTFLAWSRARGMSSGPALVRATCNPSSTSFIRKYVGPWVIKDHPRYPTPHNQWLYFVRQQPSDDIVFYDHPDEAPENTAPMSLTFIGSTLRDNPKLLEANPHYEAQLRALPHVDYRQQGMGDWDIVEGGGAVLKRKWISVWTPADLPQDELPVKVYAWDTAGRVSDLKAPKGQDRGDYTVGMLAHYYPDSERFVVMEVWRVRIPVGELQPAIVARARDLGPEVHIALEQEPGSQAAAMLAHMVRNELTEYQVTIYKPQVDKVSRAALLSSLASNGRVAIMDGPYRDTVLDEWHLFPEGPYDDTVDAATLALNTARSVQPGPKTPELWRPRVRQLRI